MHKKYVRVCLQLFIRYTQLHTLLSGLKHLGKDTISGNMRMGYLTAGISPRVPYGATVRH